jgi:predicted  nucleic acid-binding Zn-ribbon protein
MRFLKYWMRIRKALRLESRFDTSSISESTVATKSQRGELATLISEYQFLVKRRTQLQDERSELAQSMDSGQMTGNEFRMSLMSKIQELAQVATSMKSKATRLSELGYRGLLMRV